MAINKHMVVTRVPIKVLQDFVIMDEPEGVDMSVILGRPFLKTAKALIDVSTGMITFRVRDNHLTLKATRGPEEEEEEEKEEESTMVEYARSSAADRKKPCWQVHQLFKI